MSKKWYGLTLLSAATTIFTLFSWLYDNLSTLRALIYLLVLSALTALCWLQARFTARKAARAEHEGSIQE